MHHEAERTGKAGRTKSRCCTADRRPSIPSVGHIATYLWKATYVGIDRNIRATRAASYVLRLVLVVMCFARRSHVVRTLISIFTICQKSPSCACYCSPERLTVAVPTFSIAPTGEIDEADEADYRVQCWLGLARGSSRADGSSAPAPPRASQKQRCHRRHRNPIRRRLVISS